MERWLPWYLSSATRAPIQRGEPPTNPRRPQSEIGQHSRTRSNRPNRSGRQQDQSELRIRLFAFGESKFRNLADEGHGHGRRIVTLCIKERFEQFALVDANKLPRFSFEVPNPYVREQFEGRSKAALWKPRAPGDAAQPARLSIEKTNQPVPFAKRIRAQDNRLGLPQ